MADLEVDLQAYIEAAAARPFSYGDHDCAIGFVGAWVQQRTGVDVGAPWRGRYHSALSCALMVHRFGGLLAVMQHSADLARLEETTAPAIGDVGAVRIYGEHGLTLAGSICVGPRWLVLSEAGILAVAPPPVKAWSL